MSAFGVVFRKECVDNLRDRRALTTALVMPLLGPLMLVAVFFALKEAEAKSRAPQIAVVGAEHAPELITWLGQQGVEVKAPPADPEEAVRTGEADLVVRLDASFGVALRAGTPAPVEIVCDPSRQSAAPLLDRTEGLLLQYGQTLGALRLMVRGVDPQLVQAVSIRQVDVGAKDAKKALLLASLPLFLLMACFLGGTYVAIDVTAGERERGTLEPLLLNPVSPRTLVLAKIAATAVFGIASCAAGLLAFAVVVPAIPFDEIGLDLHVAPRVAFGYALLFLPTTLVAAALQVLVGVVSKNTKTAQASLGFVILVPVLPGVMVSLFPQQPSVASCSVPFLGESILAMRLLRGEDIEVLHWVANGGVQLLLAAGLTLVGARLFGARMLSG
ncbi:MAG: ABC transporter permease [Deltaproteobacteria bacterium]|nr:ABC transporter permease [Deltaproteobacteria bacterium]